MPVDVHVNVCVCVRVCVCVCVCIAFVAFVLALTCGRTKYGYLSSTVKFSTAEGILSALMLTT